MGTSATPTVCRTLADPVVADLAKTMSALMQTVGCMCNQMQRNRQELLQAVAASRQSFTSGNRHPTSSYAVISPASWLVQAINKEAVGPGPINHTSPVSVPCPKIPIFTGNVDRTDPFDWAQTVENYATLPKWSDDE